MNDRSNEILSLVRADLKGPYPSLLVTSRTITDSEAHFPTLYVRFSFPQETPGTHDSSGTEKWTRTRCVADAYSRTSLQEAKGIIAAMDASMGRLGFSRSNWTEVPTADPSVSRVQATWLASVSASGDVAAW